MARNDSPARRSAMICRIRLVVTFHAASGKGDELAQAMKARCEVSRQDAGCEQFEVFQSVSDPDKLVLLEFAPRRMRQKSRTRQVRPSPPAMAAYCSLKMTPAC
jgi:hypothetical protein